MFFGGNTFGTEGWEWLFGLAKLLPMENKDILIALNMGGAELYV